MAYASKCLASATAAALLIAANFEFRRQAFLFGPFAPSSILLIKWKECALACARVMISLSLDLGPPSKTLPHGLLIRHDRSSEIVTMMTFIATSNEEDLLTLEAAGGNEATNFTMAACTFHVGCAG